MSDQRELQELLDEFTRVGVDPDTFTAMLAVRPEEALQLLRELPDGAGPAAFLASLRTSTRPATPPRPTAALVPGSASAPAARSGTGAPSPAARELPPSSPG